MTWDDLAKEIAQMTPAERKFSVSVMIWNENEHEGLKDDEFLIDEVAFEEQGENIGETTRPILMANLPGCKNEET